MKQHFFKAGFDAVFALSLIAIFLLPALVFGQSKRRLEIRINNGDTVVNGKNIKDMSAIDREQALKDINSFKDGMAADTGKRALFFERRMFGNNDSARHGTFRFRYRGPNGRDSMMTFNYRMPPSGRDFHYEPRDFGFRNYNFEMPPMHGFVMAHRRNSQSFSYTNTDSDGIMTHINYNVSDASPERTKKETGNEKADLQLQDLVIVPEFSSGKTMLSFSLPAHTAAEVKLTDNDDKVIWNEKAANGSFSKSFTLGLNGMYLLEVKQRGKTALKRIVKEE
jgi:hypothetical protein